MPRELLAEQMYAPDCDSSMEDRISVLVTSMSLSVVFFWTEGSSEVTAISPSSVSLNHSTCAKGTPDTTHESSTSADWLTVWLTGGIVMVGGATSEK